MAKLPIKKMITEVLLLLPLYVIWFAIRWRFRHVIKIMTDAENILNDDEFFADTVDTPKEGAEQHRKRECLKRAICKGKVLGGKKQWAHERVDKASDEIINKKYGEYKQRELNEKGEKNWKSLRQACN